MFGKEMALALLLTKYAEGKEDINKCITYAFETVDKTRDEDTFEEEVTLVQIKIDILNEIMKTKRIFEDKQDFKYVIKKLIGLTKHLKEIYEEEMKNGSNK